VLDQGAEIMTACHVMADALDVAAGYVMAQKTDRSDNRSDPLDPARQAGHRGLSAEHRRHGDGPQGSAFPADEAQRGDPPVHHIRRRPASDRVAITLRIRHERAGGLRRPARSARRVLPERLVARSGTLGSGVCGTTALARQFGTFGGAAAPPQSGSGARRCRAGSRGTTAARWRVPARRTRRSDAGLRSRRHQVPADGAGLPPRRR
jgi:hypothetical protein